MRSPTGVAVTVSMALRICLGTRLTLPSAQDAFLGRLVVPPKLFEVVEVALDLLAQVLVDAQGEGGAEITFGLVQIGVELPPRSCLGRSRDLRLRCHLATSLRQPDI